MQAKPNFVRTGYVRLCKVWFFCFFGGFMKVLKVINNNIVSTCDEHSQEIIVMGRGLGFKAKEGNEIPKEKIEKIYRMESQNQTEKLKALFSNLPNEHIVITNKIITYANELLGDTLNPNIYITLTDHISFAVERFSKGMMFQNAMLMEVRRFYRKEYVIGEYAISLIKKELGIEFPADEAASIALHIVNAELKTSIYDTINITKLIQEILDIVWKAFKISIDEYSLSYERFVTHLKFLAQRICKGEVLETKDKKFVDMIKQLYPDEYKCSCKVKKFLTKTYNYEVSQEEVAYLTLHIRRVTEVADSHR